MVCEKNVELNPNKHLGIKVGDKAHAEMLTESQCQKKASTFLKDIVINSTR